MSTRPATAVVCSGFCPLYFVPLSFCLMLIPLLPHFDFLFVCVIDPVPFRAPMYI